MNESATYSPEATARIESVNCPLEPSSHAIFITSSPLSIPLVRMKPIMPDIITVNQVETSCVRLDLAKMYKSRKLEFSPSDCR